jgi:hypothetical protein
MKRIAIVLAIFILLVMNQGFATAGSATKYFERKGVFYFTAVSNGMTYKEWIQHFDAEGIVISTEAGDKGRIESLEAKGIYVDSKMKTERSLPINRLKSSKKGTVHRIAIIKGDFFSDNDRFTLQILKEADKRNFKKPDPEIACLIRDIFNDGEMKEMGLDTIIVMHEPIRDTSGVLCLLGLDAIYGTPRFGTYPGGVEYSWPNRCGFAFLAP